MNSNEKPLVNIAKLFFAINIVLLHYGVIDCLPFGSLITAMVTRLAVPYFFVASGYFWSKKIYASTDRLEQKAITSTYCKRLGFKLLIFEPISIVLFLIVSILQKAPMRETCISIIQGILFYPSGALWYIQAVIVAVLLLVPFVSRKRIYFMVFPAFVLYFIGALGNRYHFLVDNTVVGYLISRYDDIFVTTRNGLFFGFPFVFLGCLISRFEERLLQTGRAQAIKIAAAFAFSYLLCFVEYCLVNSRTGRGDNALYLSYFFVVPLLFILTARVQKTNRDTATVRNLSISIYLIHRPINIATVYIFKNILQIHSVAASTGTGILIISLICVLVYKTKKQPFYNWLI